MKNNYFILFAFVFVTPIAFQSCDKIDPPYVEQTNTSSGNYMGYINLQTIKGAYSDLKITDNWISDSSSLKAVWTITPTASGADGSITFTWHEVSTTLNISSITGIVTFSETLSINGGGDFGILSFKYEGSLTSSGSGDGYAVTYVVQNILIEDYTGHLCGNCPAAAEKITDIKSIYGDRVISMAVHAGSYAITFIPPYTYDFKTPEGIELDNHFGISNVGNPNGMVNRKTYNGNIITSHGSWAGHVNDIIIENKVPEVGIKIENTYSAFDSSLQIKVKTGFFHNLTGTYKVCVYLLEDSIQKWQKKYPPLFPLDDSLYWHHNVLRGSANGTWGDILFPSSEGTRIEKDYVMTVKNEYRVAYCKTLVFIYDDLTKEILQVKEAAIIQ
jgi:hypothetical protein